VPGGAAGGPAHRPDRGEKIRRERLRDRWICRLGHGGAAARGRI
jgi:hypothetical protein